MGTIHYNITQRCNLKCRVCPSWQMEVDDSGYDQFIEKVKHSNKTQFNELVISGGEPLLVLDKLLELNNQWKTHIDNASVILITNGTLLTQKNVDKILEADFNSITISLDSVEEKIHDFLRGSKNSFKRTIEGINRLVRTRNEKDKSVNLSVSSVLQKENLDSFSKLPSFVKTLGIDHFNFQPVHLYHPNFIEKKSTMNNFFFTDPSWIDREDIDKLDDIITRNTLLRKEGFTQVPKFLLKSLKRYFEDPSSISGNCFQKDSLYINSKGEIFPCWNYPALLTLNEIDSFDDQVLLTSLKSFWDSFTTCLNPCLLLCRFPHEMWLD